MQFPLASGNVLAARYLVERLIGAGGMAVVAVATDLTSGQRVAIKMLLPEAARSDQVQKRFQREQRTLNKLTNEHTVKLLGTGTEAEYPYMVIEYLEGTDLSDVLKMQGALPQLEAVEYVMQACEAISEAHALGITHRDLKPGNLFLTRKANGDACVKVLDFGISKVSEPHRPGESTLTGTTALLGSPFYMSPEQLISSRDVDTRTDVWSLGVTLHELLTNTLPFGAKTTEKVCKRILNDTPDPLRQFRPDMPGGLEAAILHCLRRRPTERFANVSDLALAIAEFGPPRAAQRSMSVISDFLQPTRRMQLRHVLPPPPEPEPGPPPEERTSALPAPPRHSVPPPAPHHAAVDRRPAVPPAAPSEPTLPHMRGQMVAAMASADQSYTNRAAVVAATAAAEQGPVGAAPSAGTAGAAAAPAAGGSTGAEGPTLHVERQRATNAGRLVFAGIYGLGMFVLGLVIGLVVRRPADDAGACGAASAEAEARGARPSVRSDATADPAATGPSGAASSLPTVDYDLDSTAARTAEHPAATGSAHGQSTAGGTAPAAGASAVPTATAHATAKSTSGPSKPPPGQETGSPAVTTPPVF
jgi:serine/threonine protein kinase